ncbi:AAA family ATPase [Stenotrophomonas sp. S39]|uniref:AAA family ATPase n=1 Tax=Stenotrophomonas sp. S39 TaxID=2767451 RepID=UPI00190CE652|nr:AAA family ATPase [Stenotrophomonas sp. S39]MBK0054530.1 hypothetical protein [Stenotrophomonas sp. S39]
MMEIEEIEILRGRYWSHHPLIKASAVLQTRTMKDAIARVMLAATRSRASIAFVALPLFGKSSCIKALEAELAGKFPGSGVLTLEFGDDDLAPSEGRMLETIMIALSGGDGIAKSIAGKREQVHRSLLSLSGNERHIFLLIDEAQEMKHQHFRWIKRVINHLVRADVDVTTVLFGQKELSETKVELATKGRSDLSARFMSRLFQFRGVKSIDDIGVIMSSIDSCRWTVEGRALVYTEFLFPRAYRAGFRFEQLKDDVWSAIGKLPGSHLENGLPMATIGSFLAMLCVALKDKDMEGMGVEPQLISATFLAAYRNA